MSDSVLNRDSRAPENVAAWPRILLWTVAGLLVLSSRRPRGRAVASFGGQSRIAPT